MALQGSYTSVYGFTSPAAIAVMLSSVGVNLKAASANIIYNLYNSLTDFNNGAPFLDQVNVIMPLNQINPASIVASIENWTIANVPGFGSAVRIGSPSTI